MTNRLTMKIVEAMAIELKRQYEDDECSLGHYREARLADGRIDYVAVDGNPDLYALADAVKRAIT